MMLLTVEVARPHELGAVLALLKRMNLPDSGVAEQFGHYLVARDDESVIGTCGVEVHGEDGLLRNLAVTPEHSDEGVEERLITRAEELARQMDLRVLFVLVTDPESPFTRSGYVACARNEAPRPILESSALRTADPDSSLMKRRIR